MKWSMSSRIKRHGIIDNRRSELGGEQYSNSNSSTVEKNVYKPHYINTSYHKHFPRVAFIDYGMY